MSKTIQKIYTKVLKEVSGKDWKTNKTFRIGHAGGAITCSFLENGSLNLSELKKNIPDFSQTEIRIALKRLKENGYFEKNKKGQYKLSIDEGIAITDEIFWGLLINVVNGFINRTTKE